jgi:hypothetical protein
VINSAMRVRLFLNFENIQSPASPLIVFSFLAR